MRPGGRTGGHEAQRSSIRTPTSQLPTAEKQAVEKPFRIWNSWNSFHKDVSKFPEVWLLLLNNTVFKKLQWKPQSDIIWSSTNVSYLYISFTVFGAALRTLISFGSQKFCEGVIDVSNFLEEKIIISARHGTAVEKAPTRRIDKLGSSRWHWRGIFNSDGSPRNQLFVLPL